MDANGLQIAKHDVLYLPEDVVTKSPGFAFDIGSSLVKLAYRSKEDFCQGRAISKEAIRDSKGRIHLVSLPRDAGAKALIGYIKKSCDFLEAKVTGEKLKVIVTGLGANFWAEDLQNELEIPLNIKLEVVMEETCSSRGLMYMKENLSEEEFLYPIEESWAEGAQDDAEFMKGYHKAHGRTPLENSSRLTYVRNPKPEGVKPYLPCMNVVAGSATGLYLINEKAETAVVDATMFSGKSFLGFAEYIFGEMSFEELMKMLETSDGSSADITIRDLVVSNDNYGEMSNSSRRIYPFGKCVIVGKDNIKPEDMVHSVFRTVCESLGQIGRFTAELTGSRHIFYSGSFINIPLARKLIYIDIQGRNLLLEEERQNKFHFVRHGAYCVVMGAFVRGAVNPE